MFEIRGRRRARLGDLIAQMDVGLHANRVNVFAGGVRVTESFCANNIVLMAQRHTNGGKVSLTYKHNVLNLCVIVFARPNSLPELEGKGTHANTYNQCHDSVQTSQ